MKFLSAAIALCAVLAAGSPASADMTKKPKKVSSRDPVKLPGGNFGMLDGDFVSLRPEERRRMKAKAEAAKDVTGSSKSDNFLVGTSPQFGLSGIDEGTLVVEHESGNYTIEANFTELSDVDPETPTLSLMLRPLRELGRYRWKVRGTHVHGKFTYSHGKSPVRASKKADDATGSDNLRTSKIQRNSASTERSGSDSFVGESDWEGGGLVEMAVGRIYFASHGVDYACTGSVVKDNKSGRSLIFTAAHCIWDDIDEVFGADVIFIPNRDAIHDKYGEDLDYHRRCDEDPCGCWHLSGGVVHDLWRDSPWPERLAYDYGFYVVDDVGSHEGKDCGSEALDIAIEPLEFAVGIQGEGEHITNFGYSLDFNPDFRYCAEETTTHQPTQGVDTEWMDNCGLSGGASGGPWVAQFDPAVGGGKVISTNSWSYSDKPGMGAPYIDESEARCLINAARDADMAEMMDKPEGEQGIFVNCYDRPCIELEEDEDETSESPPLEEESPEVRTNDYVCEDAWAFDSTNSSASCLLDMGYGQFGFTNGKYGTSGCSPCKCDCDDARPHLAPPKTCFQEDAASEMAKCFNLTVYNWGGGVGPWDPWAGQVCVEMNEFEKLEVTYSTASYWLLWETELWVGEDLAQLPMDVDNTPNISQFPYLDTGIEGKNKHKFTVDLDSRNACSAGADSYTLRIASAARVGDPCVPFNGSYIFGTDYPAWGQDPENLQESEGATYTYFEIEIACDCEGGTTVSAPETRRALMEHRDESEQLQLATATDDNCECICPSKITDSATPGSSNKILAPVSMDLYTGSTEDCGPKGDKVGSVYLSPNDDGTKATVTYETAGNFVLQQTHLYIGNDQMPSESSENFMYSNVEEEGQGPTNATTFTYEVDLTKLESCDFFVAAQAKVCASPISSTSTSSPPEGNSVRRRKLRGGHASRSGGSRRKLCSETIKIAAKP